MSTRRIIEMLNRFESDRYFDLGAERALTDILLRLHNAEYQIQLYSDEIGRFLDQLHECNDALSEQYDGVSVWVIFRDLLKRVREAETPASESTDNRMEDRLEALERTVGGSSGARSLELAIARLDHELDNVSKAVSEHDDQIHWLNTAVLKENTGSRSIGDKFREEGCPYRIARTQCALEGGESCRRSVCKLPLD